MSAAGSAGCARPAVPNTGQDDVGRGHQVLRCGIGLSPIAVHRQRSGGC